MRVHVVNILPPAPGRRDGSNAQPDGSAFGKCACRAHRDQPVTACLVIPTRIGAESMFGTRTTGNLVVNCNFPLTIVTILPY
jgi:hypothetical protein